MNSKPTTRLVWDELNKQLFGVLGMVTARGQSRTAGIVYVVDDGAFYIGTGKSSWKARHVAANPAVSLTVPIHKRIPLLPWIKIPAATITCHGTATLHDIDDVDDGLLQKIYRGMQEDPQLRADACIMRLVPRGDFVTYGVGVSLLQMRDPAQARGRAPVANGHVEG